MGKPQNELGACLRVRVRSSPPPLAPTANFEDLLWGLPLCLLPWQYNGLSSQEPVSFPAGGCWPFKACGRATARLGRDSDHRCQVVKLKILSDVDARAPGSAGWGGGGKSLECLCPAGGLVGSPWGFRGACPHLLLSAFLQPLEGSRMHSQEPAAMLAALGHANSRHPASP